MRKYLEFYEKVRAALRSSPPGAGDGRWDVLSVYCEGPCLNPWHMHVYESEARELVVCVSVWRQDVDGPDAERASLAADPDDDSRTAEALESLLPRTPTIERTVTTIPVERFAAFFSKVNQALLKPVAVHAEAEGVPHCEVTLGNRHTHLAVKWWGRGPKEWQPLILAVRELVAQLNLTSGADLAELG